MPISVTLSKVSWVAPNGTAVLSDLSIAFGAERTGVVGRNGSGKSTLLRLIAGDIAPSAGHVQVVGTPGVLRQEFTAGSARTIADLFGSGAALRLAQRAEAGQATAEELADADWTLPARIDAALGRCGLAADPGTPLAALSGGQRTRAGLAALIVAAPDILLLDEPTNNLDRAGREAVIEALRMWRQAAIVVSHDRELLEEMDAIVELSTLGATRTGGPYSAYRARKALDVEAAHHDLAEAEKSRAEARRRARQAAEDKARKDSRGRKGRAKGDQSKILMDAARERAEGSGGANARLRDTRREAVDTRLAEAREKVEIIDPLTMRIAPTGLPCGRTVLGLCGLSGGHDPARPVVRDLSLTLTGPERVAITGPNGCGKTTLADLITGRLAPVAGVVDLPVTFAYLDQHSSLLAPDLTLRDAFLRVNPQAKESDCRAALARFRFRGEDGLRRVGSLSGGERLRAGLACTIGRTDPPSLLILDEPTNHLDLDGIEALEAALRAYDGAILVISHDEIFLENLTLDRRISLPLPPSAEAQNQPGQ